MLRNFFLSVGLSLLMLGCASEPAEEIQKAEAAMAEAQQAEASRWAPEANQKAEAKMAEARRLIEQKDYSQAVPVLAEAERLAAAAAREAADAKREAEEEERRRAEEERRKAEAELAAKKSTHTVVKGECLWYIAGYEDVYGDPYQWPRIYNANKDQIRDPDLIYPDQVFRIPR